ncbi:progestin and adipoQ receptor family member 3a [Erpetoichthys calabaricus]|uniref:Progestin and adipoQ receptor family member IIIa n=2 Tax=Polypteridae TaxID=8289 RepID=A0A8C4SMT4_ERPCA|nr:progestin and adipoQ receptor family member 3a [Erpetoichthys calabaricus]XP_039614473.1 progestin and adipoQ receptor family member 3a [Polypterus senegalus]XP_051785513.1 progestin and adipoQ receptor family member 3a [Erpetoichthys calabaricus]
MNKGFDSAVAVKTNVFAIMPQKLLKNAHYIELGSYQYWPVLVPRGIRLYTYEQIPVFLKENPYITDGYRAYLPSRLCLKSLFILSNETVNIWSHLLGFFMFFTLGVYDMTAVLPAAKASREDYVIYSIGLFCFQVCMLCSVGYHLFCCHRSEKTSRRWMALDYAGISIGILGCYVPGVFYAFYCNDYWRQVYLITVLAMILAVFFAQIHPHYLTQQWHRLRSVIFCSVAGYGVIPTIHWVWLNGGFGALIVQEFVPRVLVMYLIAAVAFLFYISKVPERYFPGQLNYLGSSHQVWHILVVLMFYWWHQSAVYITQYRHTQPCPEDPVHA